MNYRILSFSLWLDDGKITEETKALVDILDRVHEDMTVIEELREEIKSLADSNDGLNTLVRAYQEGTTTLADRTESYLRQIKQLESDMIILRQERVQAENSIRFLHSRVQVLELELKEKIGLLQRMESTLVARNATAAPVGVEET